MKDTNSQQHIRCSSRLGSCTTTTVLILLHSLNVAAAQSCVNGCICLATSNSSICNNLSSVPHFPPELPIQLLNMSGCSFTIVKDKAFQSLPHLEIITLTDSNVRKITNASFIGLQELKEVDLSNNFITRIPPDTFIQNPVLEKVSFAHNSISLSNSPLLISESISYLNLERCKIRTLSPVSLSGLPNLRILNLRNNRLKTLSVAVFTYYTPQLTTVDLRENMWSCDTDLDRLLCWSQEKMIECSWSNGKVEKQLVGDCKNNSELTEQGNQVQHTSLPTQEQRPDSVEILRDNNYENIKSNLVRNSVTVDPSVNAQLTSDLRIRDIVNVVNSHENEPSSNVVSLNSKLLVILWLLSIVIAVSLAVFAGCKYVNRSETPQKKGSLMEPTEDRQDRPLVCSSKRDQKTVNYSVNIF